MVENLEQVLRAWVSKEYLIAWMEVHPGSFEEAVQLSMSGDNLIGWRAAWVVFHRMKANDARLRAFVGDFVRILPERESGHQRELLKILLKMKLDEDQEGRLFDVCMAIWERISKSPSVRSTALQYIVRVLKKYPEFIAEVQFITEERYLEGLSPGIRCGVERMIAGLGK